MKVDNPKFGKLAFLRSVGIVNGREHWECKCDCGKTKVARKSHIIDGNISSCGCLVGNPKHGMSATPIYVVWQGMKARCTNPNEVGYKHYGGRGITVCDRWMTSFTNFLEDMGPIPFEGAELDRVDNNKGYSKENCRWVTHTDNVRNTRSNHRITAHGKNLTITEWAETLGVSKSTIHQRIKRGMSEEESVTIPFTKTAARHHYLRKTPLVLQIGNFTATPAFFRGCIARMKEGPFRARDLFPVAEAMGAPKHNLRRVVDRVIVRMKEEKLITLLQYPVWHWIGTTAACRLAEQANKGE